MTKKITATASCRVDLAGGTLDLWPLYLFHEGAVTVNFALTVLTRATIMPSDSREIIFRSIDTAREDRFGDLAAFKNAKSFKHPLAGYLTRFFLSQPDAPTGGFTLETDSESPAGAGISGSSALMIATTAALARYCDNPMGKEAMRVLAQNVEAQLIRVPTGCQDYYPALYGGVGAVRLLASGVDRVAISIPSSELDRRFVLAYTGVPRQSGINNWEVFKAHINGNKRVQKNFAEIADIAKSMHCALTGQEWDKVTALLQREWKLRKTNAPGITTPKIDKLVEVATKNGARAAKVCGAGGGGCVVFLTEPDGKARVQQKLREAGAQVLDCKVSRRGVRVSTE
jgi:D-glycero-alpha-D-manno-heptose-7-phosphate kinase